MKESPHRKSHIAALSHRAPNNGALAIAAMLLSIGLFGCDKTPEEFRWSSEIESAPGSNYKSALDYGEQQFCELTRQTIHFSHPQVSVYSNAAPPKVVTAPLTLKDLSDHAQASVVDAEAANPSHATQLRANLAKGLADSVAVTQGLSDPFRFDRTLIVTVIKGTDALPGDRLIWTRIFVQPENFQFANYSIPASDLQTQKIASIEDTTTQKVSGTFGASAPLPIKPTVSVTPDFEHASKADADLSQQYQNLGVDIQPDFVRIYRESERGLDVSGNTLLNVTLIANQAMRSEELVLIGSNPHLYDGAEPLPPGKASIEVQPQYPLLHRPLMARVWMLYEARKIISGRGSYDEGSQSVMLVRDASDYDTKANKPGLLMPIMTADEVSPAIWKIVNIDDHEDILAGVKGGIPRSLVFTDFGAATQVAHWIRETGARSIGPNLVLTYTSKRGGGEASLAVSKRSDPSPPIQVDTCKRQGSDKPSNVNADMAE